MNNTAIFSEDFRLGVRIAILETAYSFKYANGEVSEEDSFGGDDWSEHYEQGVEASVEYLKKYSRDGVEDTLTTEVECEDLLDEFDQEFCISFALDIIFGGYPVRFITEDTKGVFCRLSAHLSFNDFVDIAEIEEYYGIDNAEDYAQFLTDSEDEDVMSSVIEFMQWQIEDDDCREDALWVARNCGMADEDIQLIWNFYGIKNL